MFSILTTTLVSLAILHQRILCTFEELEDSLIASSEYATPNNIPEIDTSLSLIPGSSSKKYPVNRESFTRQDGQHDWFELNEEKRKDLQTLQLIPLHTENLLQETNNIVNNFPGMHTSTKNLNDQQGKTLIGANEDVVLSLGIPQQQLSMLVKYHKSYFIDGPHQGPNEQIVRIDLSQTCCGFSAVYDMRNRPGNKRHYSEVAFHGSTTNDGPHAIKMHLLKPTLKIDLIIPERMWDFNDLCHSMQPNQVSGYATTIKVLGDLRQDWIEALEREGEGFVTNLCSILTQQDHHLLKKEAIRNMISLFHGIWIRQSAVAELFKIQNRTQDLQIHSFESLASILQNHEFTLAPLSLLKRKPSSGHVQNEYFRLFNFIHTSPRQTKTKKNILFHLQCGILNKWNFIEYQKLNGDIFKHEDKDLPSFENDSALRKIFQEHDSIFYNN
ncbi:uncharacterized protein MELLADRAFT_101737 [Melampsora larici-populina 98AG31]|uniref:Secreted protein n=1 Tax=Melampsora larici-populina (strain 98AG31 / pathotype 3-4-7) TaxID=747676 RepID=F4R6T1_MELLP|nr:uncharacterized protein MELLADRAFT_101737 [Melampsora larici-populina 98AG31]EGG12404.1 hypothetical protein MELLADRAFT_101737 [Melampsora larici-populina 98AG31]